MGFYDVLEKVADETGESFYSIALKIGRASSYVSSAAARGSVPSVDNAAAMLAACGWSLVAVPSGDVPPSALVIEPPDAGDAERRALERKRDRLRRELAATDALLG